jgi:hypothetical protein
MKVTADGIDECPKLGSKLDVLPQKVFDEIVRVLWKAVCPRSNRPGRAPFRSEFGRSGWCPGRRTCVWCGGSGWKGFRRREL